MRPDPTADAVARFEHGDGLARLAQPASSGQPGVSGADDTDVHIDSLSHRRLRLRCNRLDAKFARRLGRRSPSPRR